MKKVSVVVPAYNSHDTLARCLGSLVNQTLQDIEVIVVNDASKDDTLEIMKRCRDQFPDKVVVIDGSENLGCGGARSVGLDAATGEYIGMADADDYVEPTMYEKLYKRAVETGADIVDSGFYSEATDKAQLFAGDDMTGELNDEKRSRLITSGGYLVTKIFKNELFNDPPIRMQKNMAALEDLEIFIYMYLRAKRLETVKEVFYYYCNTPGSNTKMVDVDKYFDAIYRAMQYTHKSCCEMPAYNGSKMAIEYMLTNIYSYGVNRCIYDQIKRYGADKGKVRQYFNNVPPKETEMLKKLAALKNEVVTVDYEQNAYTCKLIDALDIAIIKECDRRFGRDI